MAIMLHYFIAQNKRTGWCWMLWGQDDSAEGRSQAPASLRDPEGPPARDSTSRGLGRRSCPLPCAWRAWPGLVACSQPHSPGWLRASELLGLLHAPNREANTLQSTPFLANPCGGS